MTTRIPLIVFLMVMLSCSTKNKHPRILSKEEMQQVTWDIMLVDEQANGFYRDSTITKPDIERRKLYLKVFQVHNISREDYNASLRYYAAKPDLMKVIFDSLSVKGERERLQRTKPVKAAG